MNRTSRRQAAGFASAGGGTESWAQELLSRANLRVALLKAEFMIDENGMLWFSHASEVRVQLTNAGPDAAAAREAELQVEVQSV